jgi:hypothetical protein
LAAALAWQYRKDKFLLLGAVCMAFTIGAMIARSGTSEWIFNSLMIAAGISAAISIAFGVRDLLRFLAEKRNIPQEKRVSS